MRGGGHSNYVQNPVKRADYEREVAERSEIDPHALAGYFPAEWIHAVDSHQREIGSVALSRLISEPFPKSKHKDDQELQKFASNNLSVYDDDIEDEMEQDEILSALIRERTRYTGDEAYSKLVRTRRTLLAYMVFSAIEDHSAA